MNRLLVISFILFVSSIVIFLLKNGSRQLTLKQIIMLGGRKLGSLKPGYPIIGSTFSDLLLLTSVVVLIIHYDYSALVEIFGALCIIFIQKIIILLTIKLKNIKT